jgi:hypothetical protein
MPDLTIRHVPQDIVKALERRVTDVWQPFAQMRDWILTASTELIWRDRDER